MGHGNAPDSCHGYPQELISVTPNGFTIPITGSNVVLAPIGSAVGLGCTLWRCSWRLLVRATDHDVTARSDDGRIVADLSDIL